MREKYERGNPCSVFLWMVERKDKNYGIESVHACVVMEGPDRATVSYGGERMSLVGLDGALVTSDSELATR